MIDNAISLSLMWIFLGASIWALMDPKVHADYVTRRYVARYRKLPPAGFVFASVVWSVLCWPKLARVLWRRSV